jgi:hypothetical protein
MLTHKETRKTVLSLILPRPRDGLKIRVFKKIVSHSFNLFLVVLGLALARQLLYNLRHTHKPDISIFIQAF